MDVAFRADADYWRSPMHPSVLTAAGLDAQGARVSANRDP